MKEFVNENEHLSFDMFMKRGYHPYVSATYVNGYVKDIPLRNEEGSSVESVMNTLNSTCKSSCTHSLCSWQRLDQKRRNQSCFCA